MACGRCADTPPQCVELERWVYRWLHQELEEEYNSLDHILYADEAGLSSAERYAWGWSERGKPCGMPRPGGHGEKRNWISAILASDHRWQMPWVVQGTINRGVVEQWAHCVGEVTAIRDRDTQALCAHLG